MIVRGIGTKPRNLKFQQMRSVHGKFTEWKKLFWDASLISKGTVRSQISSFKDVPLLPFPWSIELDRSVPRSFHNWPTRCSTFSTHWLERKREGNGSMTSVAHLPAQDNDWKRNKERRSKSEANLRNDTLITMLNMISEERLPHCVYNQSDTKHWGHAYISWTMINFAFSLFLQS